jgi:hypothetical protein
MRDWRYSATDSETRHQMESSGQLHTPSAIAPLKEPPVYPQQGACTKGVGEECLEEGKKILLLTQTRTIIRCILGLRGLC